ncbi:MAG TPA: hypothetical protein VEZ90_09325, partial [Blastocatellia bacterium]|nr:hypothetical protein [Blastocatellia bacterium]
MNRAEIEIALHKDRASTLEALLAMPADSLSRGVTPSRHDNSFHWSPKDHLVHLIGTERFFNSIIRQHLEGDPSPIPLPKDEAGNL